MASRSAKASPPKGGRGGGAASDGSDNSDDDSNGEEDDGDDDDIEESRDDTVSSREGRSRRVVEEGQYSGAGRQHSLFYLCFCLPDLGCDVTEYTACPAIRLSSPSWP